MCAMRIRPGRLVTLAGPGGVGKTRLATEVGLRVADDWPDGAWMVDLAPIDEPSLIAAGRARRTRCAGAGRRPLARGARPPGRASRRS